MAMLSPVVICAVTLVAGMSGDEAQPGRDGNYTWEVASVEGTEWTGKLGGLLFTIRFERGGVVCYTLLGAKMRDLTWKQQDNVIVMRAINGYSEFRLVIDGQRLRGEGHNKANENWKLDMKSSGRTSKPCK
jgi:hypothetical protein